MAAGLVCCLGCDDRDTKIRSYTVPKEKPAPTFGTPVPHPAVAFGAMEWDLPDGWARVANPNPMRFATFSAGEGNHRIEIAVTQLGGAAGGLAANIDRWRGQLGLPPVGESELARSVQPVRARGAQGVVVDLIGTPSGPDAQPSRMLAAIFSTDTHTWFIKTTASGEVLERHREAFWQLCESVRFTGTAAAPTAPRAPAAAFARPPPPTWELLPAGWTVDAPPKAMSVVSFTISNGSREASLTITPLGGDQDLLANINRWRRQVGLGPVADVGEEHVPVEVAGQPGSLVDIVGTERRILGVISKRGAMTWFYKLSGPDLLVASHRPAFDAFIRSIRFGEDANE